MKTDMKTDIKAMLRKLTVAVIAEAGRNEAFARELERILTGKPPDAEEANSAGKRKRRKRQPPVFNPMDIGEEEGILVERLHALSVEQLRDIVAAYGMDPSGRALRWNQPDQLIAFILEVSHRRVTKGDAFRDCAPVPHPVAGGAQKEILD